MRLLHAKTLEIIEFQDDSQTPSYAILSHTWDDEECTLRDMSQPEAVSRKGYAKIKHCCDQALEDGLEYAWVDTCNIDKTSTAELSEAINSMYRWYQKAAICYAFLQDVNDLSELKFSKWFTRGWCLQELLAPDNVKFYTSGWQYLGSKKSPELIDQISDITSISKAVLLTGEVSNVSVACRMFWASRRETTRKEDMSYCLLGIFGVNMPLLYGEGGTNAFLRLQQEIMKISDDHSMFAWGLSVDGEHIYDQQNSWAATMPLKNLDLTGLFAKSPADFTNGDMIIPLDAIKSTEVPTLSARGVQIRLPVLATYPREQPRMILAALSCTLKEEYKYYLAISVIAWKSKCYARYGKLVLYPAGAWSSSTSELEKAMSTILVKQPVLASNKSLLDTISLARGFRTGYLDSKATLDEVYCFSHASFLPLQGRIHLSQCIEKPHAILFFSFKRDDDSSKPYRFAIFLGGDLQLISKFYSVFVRLTEEEQDTQSHRKDSIKPNEELAMTKGQLIDYLSDEHFDVGCIVNHRRDWSRNLYSTTNKFGMSLPHIVTVEISKLPCNIVQESVFIVIRFKIRYGKSDHNVGKIPYKPLWWDYTPWRIRETVN